MADPAQDGRERREKAGLGAQRFRVALLVLTLFGAPLALMVSYLWMRNAALLPPFGQQPGGEIAGHVALDDGSPAPDAAVRVMLHPRASDPTPFRELKTDAKGAFSVKVPAIDGCYTVVAGGGTWVAERREVSLLEGGAQDLAFTLEPGCQVSFGLSRRDGAPIRGGEFELTRESRSFLPVPSAATTGDLNGPKLTCDGLPPGRWKLRIRLDDGTEAEYQLELKAGRNDLALEPF